MTISQSKIKEYFEYRNGYLFWRKSHGGMKSGDLAGCKDKIYWRISFNYRLYSLHRLIWIYFNGNIPKNMEIDHIDRNPLNNSIENLRLTTPAQNKLNNGAVNVQYRVECTQNPWQARIRSKYKSYSKSFKTKEESQIWASKIKLDIIENIK